MKIPLNRIVAFAGPYIAVVSGGAATWLVAHVDVLALPGVGSRDHLATLIAGGIAGGFTAGLTWLGHSKWLKGHHIELVGAAQVQAAGLTNGSLPPHLPVGADDLDGIDDEDLPDDADELRNVPELDPGEMSAGQDPGEPPLRPMRSE